VLTTGGLLAVLLISLTEFNMVCIRIQLLNAINLAAKDSDGLSDPVSTNSYRRIEKA
jgi:hypothetical protein